MRYTRVSVNAIAYELPPVVVTSAELETRLAPVYQALHIPFGQLESLTGIVERRWWQPGMSLSQGAAAAARKALTLSGIKGDELGAMIYAGVCREQFEPATACRVADQLGVGEQCQVYDLSNACLGVMNGIIDVANRIELGQIRCGMVVSCESARDIVEASVQRLLANPSMDLFKSTLATLTGGSGAIAVILTDGSFEVPAGCTPHRLLGGEWQTAPQHHALCRWGLTGLDLDRRIEIMRTDSVAVLRFGVELGTRTWRSFLGKLNWTTEQVDKVICHQVGSGHHGAILKALGIPAGKDFTTFRFLGNIGTVSCLITAAMAEERKFLKPKDRVSMLGIGSGLNCMMLGLEW